MFPSRVLHRGKRPSFTDLLITTAKLAPWSYFYPTSKTSDCKGFMEVRQSTLHSPPLPRLATSQNVRRYQMSRSETRLRIRYRYDDSSTSSWQVGSAESEAHATVLFVPLYSIRKFFSLANHALLSTDSSHQDPRVSGQFSSQLRIPTKGGKCRPLARYTFPPPSSPSLSLRIPLLLDPPLARPRIRISGNETIFSPLEASCTCENMKGLYNR